MNLTLLIKIDVFLVNSMISLIVDLKPKLLYVGNLGLNKNRFHKICSTILNQ